MRKDRRKVSCILGLLILFCFLYKNVLAVENLEIKRIYGLDRYETASKICEEGWRNTSKYAIIVTGNDFSDALCSSVLAKKYNAPILLNGKEYLNENVKKQLLRLKVENAIIIGGEAIIASAVENEIEDLNIDVRRIFGKNRYETSVKIAEELQGVKEVVIAIGSNFPDALSIAPICSMKNMPILLIEGSSIPEETEKYLQSIDVNTTYIIGGYGIIPHIIDEILPNVKRISGENRYSTNVEVISNFQHELSLEEIYIATGKNFPDALTTATLSSMKVAPLLLVDNELNEITKDYIMRNPSFSNINLVGGEKIISYDTVNDLFNENKEDEETEDSVVFFKDENLEKVIRETINKPTGKLSISDLASIVELNAADRYIKDLTGIEKLTNIKNLDLSENELANNLSSISKLKTLENLKMQHIYTDIMHLNCQKDMRFLKGLTNLKKLDLGYNNIETGLEVLSEFKNLQELNLVKNNIKSIEPLRYLDKLTYLNLGSAGYKFNMFGNKILDITPIENLEKLRYLDIGYNNIQSIKNLNKLTMLEYLNIERQYNDVQLDNIDVVRNFSKLRGLILDNQDINDLSAVRELTNLEKLSLYNCDRITDFNDLRNLVELKELCIFSEGLSDITALENLNKIEKLSITRNGYLDIKSIENLTELKELNLFGSYIKNVEVISRFKNLESLSLYYENFNMDLLRNLTRLKEITLPNNNISDISVLNRFKNLEKLDLSNNNISDITSLTNLKQLEWIDLYNNNISDIEPLMGLSNLRMMTINGNQVSEEDMKILKKLLPECLFSTRE